MSVIRSDRRRSIRDIRGAKGKVPIVCLTAYTTPMAKLLDTEVDVLLVGDSLGMVVYGLPSTLAVTLDMMIAHGAAVVRGMRLRANLLYQNLWLGEGAKRRQDLALRRPSNTSVNFGCREGPIAVRAVSSTIGCGWLRREARITRRTT